MPQPTFCYAAHITNVCISNVLARSAQQHFTWAGRQSAIKVGHGVLAISVAAGTGADVMACGASAAGPTPDVRHQPPGYPGTYPDLYCTNYCITWDILGYPELSQNEGYPGLSWVMSG